MHTRQPIFIGGMMKSGTSLTRVLLGQHPQLFASYETHWFTPEVEINWSDNNSRMIWLKEMFQLTAQDFEKIATEAHSNKSRPFIECMMEFVTMRANKSRWIEKTPDNILYWKKIAETWENASLIHVVRDPRDIFASWKTKKNKTLSFFLERATVLYNQIGSIRQCTDYNYHEVVYEQLVSQTEMVMRGLLQHLNEDWDSVCSQINTGQTQQERDKLITITGKDSPTYQSLAKPIFSTSVAHWKDQITREEALQIEKELAVMFELWGEHWPDFET